MTLLLLACARSFVVLLIALIVQVLCTVCPPIPFALRSMGFSYFYSSTCIILARHNVRVFIHGNSRYTAVLLLQDMQEHSRGTGAKWTSESFLPLVFIYLASRADSSSPLTDVPAGLCVLSASEVLRNSSFLQESAGSLPEVYCTVSHGIAWYMPISSDTDSLSGHGSSGRYGKISMGHGFAYWLFLSGLYFFGFIARLERSIDCCRR